MRDSNADSFTFDYDPGVIRFGSECVAGLEEELRKANCDSGLIVCGKTVGSTPGVIDPVKEGLGDAYAGTFDETTPEKHLETAVECAQRITESGADAVVGVGGGSSLDVATVAAVIAASDLTAQEAADNLESNDTLEVPETGVPSVFVVPTTLAGADLSMRAEIMARPESGLVSRLTRGVVGDPKLMPAGAFYDPELVATTPRDILAGSAMNGFDKGIETLYARTQTPITDATSSRGLRLLAKGLPTLDSGSETTDLDAILQGIILVQYGLSRPGLSTLSVIHAFGHGLRAHTGIQQGVAHAIIAPHALEAIFEEADGRRALMAEALGIDTREKGADEIATAIVAEVTDIRDALEVPTRLREMDTVSRSKFDAIAETTSEDHLFANAPEGLSISPEWITEILEAAW